MGAAHLAVFWATAAEAPPPGLDSLAQYGVLGILAAVFGWFAYRAYVREAARADRLEAEVNRLNTVIQDKALPAVLAATEVVKDYTTLLRDQRPDLARGPWRDGYAPAAGPADGGGR